MMFCESCGNELKNEWKICPACGKPNKKVENSNLQESEIKSKKISKKGIAAIAVVVIILFLIIIGSGDAVSDIKDSMLPEYSEEITIGEAFENFFYKPSWSSYESGDDEVVVFNGYVYTDLEEKVKVTMKMIKDEEKIRWEEVILYNADDGETTYLTDLELESLLNAIYEGGIFSWVW